MAINWESVGEQKFNVYDPICGFWTKDGFTNDQHKSEDYIQSELSKEQKETIEKHNCILMSA